MNIENNSKTQRINVVSQNTLANKKSDIEYQERDIANSPDPAEYLGRSQIKFKKDSSTGETKTEERFETTTDIINNIDEFLKTINPTDVKNANRILDLYREVTEGYKNCTNKEEYETVYNLDLKISGYIDDNFDKLISTDELDQKFMDYMLEVQANKVVADNKDFALFKNND